MKKRIVDGRVQFVGKYASSVSWRGWIWLNKNWARFAKHRTGNSLSCVQQLNNQGDARVIIVHTSHYFQHVTSDNSILWLITDQTKSAVPTALPQYFWFCRDVDNTNLDLIPDSLPYVDPGRWAYTPQWGKHRDFRQLWHVVLNSAFVFG